MFVYQSCQFILFAFNLKGCYKKDLSTVRLGDSATVRLGNSATGVSLCIFRDPV